MRLRKGDKVEVMNKKEASVSWHVAKILSGNGRTYRIQYDHYPGMAGEQIETVSRKFVRPCPPPMQGLDNCIVGDIVEVFYEYAWKIAAILKVRAGIKEIRSNKVPSQDAAVHNQYLVRLLGCSREFVVDGSNIRLWQTWQDGKWILIEKSSQGQEDVIASKPSNSNSYQKIKFQVPTFNATAKNQPQNDGVSIRDEAALWESHMISSRSLKRMSPYGSSIIEANNGHVQRLRAIEKDGRKQRVVAAPVLEKEDVVAYPRELLGENNMHASFKIISTGYSQVKRAKLSGVLGYSWLGNSETNSDSNACSVGSCSVTDQSPKNVDTLPQSWKQANTLCGDAESYNDSGSKEKSSSLPPKEEVQVSIHRLELHAYRRTLEALYASGPLSWEQEALLTNLRITLHISNDEHLLELKHLISAKTAINIR